MPTGDKFELVRAANEQHAFLLPFFRSLHGRVELMKCWRGRLGRNPGAQVSFLRVFVFYLSQADRHRLEMIISHVQRAAHNVAHVSWMSSVMVA